MKKRVALLLIALTLTLSFNIRSAAAHEWSCSELSWSQGAETPGWHGWWFRYGTSWFQFTFTGIDTDLIDCYVRVEFHLLVTNHANGEEGLDGLIDVIINPDAGPTKTYTNVLLDNIDPQNHVYLMGDSGGSYETYGKINVPKSYIQGGQLIIRVMRHMDQNDAPTAPVCTNQPIDMSTSPPTIPTGVYEDNDAHRVHLYVWCKDGDGGHTVTSEGGCGYVSIISDRQLFTVGGGILHTNILQQAALYLVAIVPIIAGTAGILHRKRIQ
jgi:hypothetical protein